MSLFAPRKSACSRSEQQHLAIMAVLINHFQQGLGVFELLLGAKGRVEQVQSVALLMAEREEDFKRIGDNVGFDIGVGLLFASHHQGKLGHFAT